jgi:diguanylate cyclase (GGDEF)-like protein
VQGIYGALWCYPVLLLLYFVLPRRLATGCSLALMATAGVMASRYIGPDVAIRMFASMTLTILINNIVVKVIGDLQGQMQQQAIKDPLTGAFNRRHMESRLSDAVERHARTGAPASLLLFDIDHFKRVNDRQGHAVGDAVLKALVDLVGRRTRSIDHLFRVGGEEFLLLRPDTPAAEAMVAAEHLRHAVAEATLGSDDRITVSVGVSTFRAGDSPDRWVQRADACLYDAKQANRNRVVSGESFAAFGRRAAGLTS